MEDFYKKVYQAITDGLDELSKQYDLELEEKSEAVEKVMDLQNPAKVGEQISALKDYAECFGKSKMLFDIRCYMYQTLKKAQEGELK